MPIVNNELSFGLAGSQGGIIGAEGAPLVSAATITVTDSFHDVSGTAVITTINCDALAPNSLLYLRPAAGSTWSLATGGNITRGLAATVGETVALEWDGTNVRPAGAQAGQPYNAAAYGVRSAATAAANVAAIRAAIADIKAAGGGVLRFPSSVGTFDASFDDLVTTYYILFGLPSNTTISFEAGAKLRVTGAVPANFAGVWGPDVTAMPVDGLKLNLRMQDTISVANYLKVRAVQLTPGAAAIANGVSDVEIEDGTFDGFASPVSILGLSGANGANRAVRKVRIVNNVATGCLSSFATVDGDDILVEGNTAWGDSVTPANSYDGVSVHCGRDVRIANNHFRYFGHAAGIGINIRNSNATDGPIAGSNNVTAIGNTFLDCDNANCIRVSTATGETEYGVRDIVIKGNTFKRCRRGVDVIHSGDIGTPCNGIVVRGNTGQCYERGVVVRGSANTKRVKDFTISGNIIEILPNTATMLTGTVTVTLASAALTGVGTAFLTQLAIGNWIEVGGTYAEIQAVADDTNATLTANWSGAVTLAGAKARMYAAEITAANSNGLWVSECERGTVSDNTVMHLNGALNGEGVCAAWIGDLRNVTFSGNTVNCADQTIANAIHLEDLVACTMTGNTFLGLVQQTTFSTGMASNNFFRTVGSTFNGHGVGDIAWGFDTSVFWKYGTAAPGAETWAQGDTVRNLTPDGAIPTVLWICTAGGTPGTWVAQVAN